MTDRRSYVGENTVLYFCVRMVLADIYEGYRIERVSGIRRTVGVDGIVAVTVIRNDDDLVVIA